MIQKIFNLLRSNVRPPWHKGALTDRAQVDADLPKYIWLIYIFSKWWHILELWALEWWWFGHGTRYWPQQSGATPTGMSRASTSATAYFRYRGHKLANNWPEAMEDQTATNHNNYCLRQSGKAHSRMIQQYEPIRLTRTKSRGQVSTNTLRGIG